MTDHDKPRDRDHTSLNRRHFLYMAGALALNPQAASAGEQATEPSPRGTWEGVVLQSNEGEALVAGRRRAPMRIKVDSTKALGATMSMVISEVAPGASIPIHLHRNEDELIFIHSGTGIITLGDQRVPSSAGAVLYAPKGVWHGVENTGPDVIKWCAIWSPPGFEQYFRETGIAPGHANASPTPAQIRASARKHGMVFKDPL